MNDPERPRDRAVLWREPALDNLELLRATFVTHAFGRHAHDEFAIGVIERGTQRFFYRGAARIAPAGRVVVLAPGEVHDGQAATTDGYSYRMLYPPPAWMARAAADLTRPESALPFFANPIIDNPALARQIRTLHLALENQSSRLARDSLLLAALTHLIARHGAARPATRGVRQEHTAVETARACIEGRFTEEVSLDDLAGATRLSPYYLLRVFRNAVGLPPHAYLDQVRVRHAKELLAAGVPIAETAAATGFADQSHLTRRFKRLVGVTPGQYRTGSKNRQDRKANAG